MRWAYVDGALVPVEETVVRADTGAAYGRGLVETMRSYSGRLFRFGAHYERLIAGAAVLGIDVSTSVGELERALVSVLERNEVEDARLRLIVTAGGATARVIALALPLDARTLGEGGMSAIVSETRRNEMSQLSRIKSLQRVDDQLAREAAQRLGADEAILLNTQGNVAEGSVSNLFLVANGRLATPSVESGALPGVARQAVLELAAEAGIEAVERVVAEGELREADECFVTNSVIELVPLTLLGGQPIGSGGPGPMTARLREMYRELVVRETATTVC